MATTSIWRIGGSLNKLLKYVENPDKTTHLEKKQWLSQVIGYATQSGKTEVIHNEGAGLAQQFLACVNCSPKTAIAEMMAVKKLFGKTDGTVAYHGYQSFAPGEATPQQAHEIGIKLAEKLWGNRHQVVVATHLDKANHLHNHFVLNNVSFVDGRKYYRSKRDYYAMQRESDELCREYGLSVVDTPKRGKSKHYSEWRDEKHGKPTYRSMVKTDFDAAIRQSMTERQLWVNLKKKGYEIKFGQDITLRPPGKERGLKLFRNFGGDYSLDEIRRRILAQRRPERAFVSPPTLPKKAYVKGDFHKTKRIAGLRALYFSYLYKMGILPKNRGPNPKQVYFLFREDICFLRNISRETRLLVRLKIDMAEQLESHKTNVLADMNKLCEQRKNLRYKIRNIKNEDELISNKPEIAELSEKIKRLRGDVKLCEAIEKRSVKMGEKIQKWREDRQNEPSVRQNSRTERRKTL